jgi:hypothetical protein
MKKEVSDEVSRRSFLRAAAGLAFFTTSGCDDVEDWLGMGPKEGPVVPPTGEGIDLISHVLNRVTFGPTPGEHARVRAMADTENEAVLAYLDEQLSPDKIDDKRAQSMSIRKTFYLSS